ncbi:MAG: RNA-binding S4 domain-containing protein [Coprobacter sp.]|nr:RNA-binding S4 domain-containing protein [Coprobacter sp.]
MERENKARRPRIGENKGAAGRDGNMSRYEKVDYSRRDENSYNAERKPRTAFNGDRNYNRNSYGNDYNRRPYNRPSGNFNRNNEMNGERNYNTDRPYGRKNYGENDGYNNGNRPYRPSGNRPYGQYNNSGNRPYNRNNFNGGNRPGGFGGGNNRPYGNRPRRNDNYSAPRKRIIYDESNIDPNEPIRLNKYMANAGICSRREADEFIQAGQVKVNGEVISELGTKITRNDVVTFQDKVVTLEHKIYVLLNKPKDCVTTSDDPQGRLTVMDIVRNACTERIYPVGRLDRNTTGVLLLTNDGDLASKLTHPKFVKKKIYHVWTDKDVSEEDMQKIADGIELEDGPIHADAVSYATDTDKNQVGIEIHSGRNRIVRRMFEALGYKVTRLDRVYFAGLTKKNLPRGRWRYLTQQEVNILHMGAFE